VVPEYEPLRRTPELKGRVAAAACLDVKLLERALKAMKEAGVEAVDLEVPVAEDEGRWRAQRPVKLTGVNFDSDSPMTVTAVVMPVALDDREEREKPAKDGNGK